MSEPISETQTEFTHSRGWRLVLAKSADDLTLGDVEDWLTTYRAIEGGNSWADDSRKVLVASIQTNWIVEPVLTANDVRDIKPAMKARWMSDQINEVYALATVVPAK
jgi:hypothetical protein